MPESAAQSAISSRSRKSPAPKSLSLRSENTGMATPEPCHHRSRPRKQSSSDWVACCISRLYPSSHAVTSPVVLSRTMNLYSAPITAFAGRLISQYGNEESFIGRALTVSQLPNAGLEPANAISSEGNTTGASTRTRNSPWSGGGSGADGSVRRKIQSVKADDRNGLIVLLTMMYHCFVIRILMRRMICTPDSLPDILKFRCRS